MLGIISAIISTTAFSLLAVIYKRLRERGVGPIAVMGIGAICIPVWIFLGMTMWLQGDYPNLNSAYIVSIVVWLIGVFILNWGDKYLYAHRGLTELKSYGAAISLLVGFGIDSFFFTTSPRLFSITAALLLLIGGFILSKNANYLPQNNNRPISLKIVIGILTLSALLFVVDATAYKTGVNIQRNILYQIVFTQTLLHSLFFIGGARQIQRCLIEKKITKQDILLIFSLLLIATFFEVFMVKNFSLMLLMVLPIISLVLFSFYDFKNGQLQFSKQSLAALVFVALGLVLSQI